MRPCHPSHRFARLALLAACHCMLGGCATAQVNAWFGEEPPAWTADLRSNKDRCTDAAAEAQPCASAMGIAAERMHWL
jgi:hypothetical protein